MSAFDQSWHSIHIYYYDVNKDALLLDCVRPLIATLYKRGWADRSYFTRHWQGGSHLRLHVHADHALFESEIAPCVVGEVEAYLYEHPSGGSFTSEEAVRQYQRRSNMTLEQLAYVAPVPNNSLHLAPYRQPVGIGSPELACFLEDYYGETTDLAFTIIEQTRNDYRGRLNACFDQLVAFVAAGSLIPLAGAYMSYRSHAEAYIVCEPDVEEPRLRRRRFERAFHERHDAVMRRITFLLDALNAAPERLANWLPPLIALHRRYGEKALQGVLEGSFRLNGNSHSREYRLSASDFHAAVATNLAVKQHQNSPYVLAQRIVLNFLYLHLSRLGLLNEDRYLLDYYIAGGIEELCHISPVDVIRNFKGFAPGTPS
ncbi:MAG TPA: lantibiotic dehydratase C-terminal domain-containing protein [Ktedonobacteraceae bacterium]|nr:lantibiotic dehydratase C-terminal domain-containing protein [Ktedonobacteraceae bacterium]